MLHQFVWLLIYLMVCYIYIYMKDYDIKHLNCTFLPETELNSSWIPQLTLLKVIVGADVKGSHWKSLINLSILQAAFPHLPLLHTFLSLLNNATLLF